MTSAPTSSTCTSIWLRGAPGFVRSLEPVIRYAAESGLRLSIENTPRTTPADFNQTFASLRELDAVGPRTVGMCLDLGHANLCTPTHNDFIRYIDELRRRSPSFTCTSTRTTATPTAT